MLHQINLADGEDVAPPVKFVPPNGKTWALNLYKGVIYTHASQGCGGNPNDPTRSILRRKKSALGSGRRRHVGSHRPGN